MKIKCTFGDVEIYNHVLNSPSNAGFGIKDLKLIKHCREVVKANLPPKVQRPELPPPADGKQYTPDEAKEHSKLFESWGKQTKENYDKEIELDLTDSDKMILIQKFNEFKGFQGDEQAINLVFQAASKLGIDVN